MPRRCKVEGRRRALSKRLQQGIPTLPVRLDLGDVLTVVRSGLFDRDWFLARNPDIAAAGIDPATHYCRYGWREGRRPNPYFDPSWYVQRHRDVRESGAEPLLHYIEHGEAEGRQPIAHFEPDWYRARHEVPPGQGCLQHFLRHRLHGAVSPVPEFDAAYYRRQFPDVAAAGMDPFEHYLVQGAREGRAASAGFDTAWYQQRYLRDRPGENPLLHYRSHRHDPGIFPVRPALDTDIPREVRRNTAPGPLFERAEPLPPGAPRRATVLAFYLPQFHPIPENDAWWGDGFTEWTNVGRGVPRFAGHYQPRIPRDLGHYRLDDPATLRAQVAMARGAGLGGFVYYFYWFNGRRLLHRPLEAMLADPGVGFPFCLMWANENWTRRWDGAEQEVLVAQDHRAADEPALIGEFVRHFADPRYIRLQGRPLLMVYRAGVIPRPAAAVARWRALFRAAGEDPVFAMAQSFGDRDPRRFGMDAAVEFPPHKLTDGLAPLPGLHMLDHSAAARIYGYDDLADASGADQPPYPLIRTALPGWDNDARRQGAGMVLHGSTPAKYEAWLRRLVDAAVADPLLGTPLVCVNAWNEWAEGAYLEPDVHFGSAYLNATARAVTGAAARPARLRLLLVGHDAFPAGAQMLLLSLARHFTGVMGLEVAVLLLGGGALAEEYRAVAPTTDAADPTELPRLARAFHAQGFTAALVNSAASAHACAPLAAAGIGCTLLVHELPRLLQERGLVEPAREAASLARHVVFAAPFVRDRFAELAPLPPGRAAVLPQGLYRPVRGVSPADRDAMRAELGLPCGALLAMGLGYADLRKGFDLFLQAWRLAHACRAGIHMLWIGDMDPSVQSHLAAEMAAAAATGTFHHRPRRADAADWLACADVHLLTSREDPFPSVVLEAMSAGVPTIAFAGAGGAPDLLLERGAGVAVPLGDAAAMVRALHVLGLRSRAEDRSRLAARTRQDFCFGAYAARVMQLAAPDAPDVSVVVPNYNYARFLPGRIASIAAQTHPVREVIVLDDASTDDSHAAVRLAAAEAGRTVRWVGSERNSGSVFRQWRRGLELAAGDWLWIAEADDMAEPGFLAALCGALRGAPDAVMAFTDSRAVDAAGAPLWPDHKGYYAQAGAALLARDGVHPASDMLRACLGRRNLILNASAVLWRRDALRRALDRCGAELDRFTMAGDWRVYAEVLSAGGSVAYVAQPLNIHRRHAASVTRRLPPRRHLQEISRMQRHMRGLLGRDPALLAGQRQAMQEARAALTPAT